MQPIKYTHMDRLSPATIEQLQLWANQDKPRWDHEGIPLPLRLALDEIAAKMLPNGKFGSK